MKTERLYAITIYLLNHGRTSAKVLAKHFEVSVRTIQRDMDSLCLAGIPIISVSGASGGYEIARQFGLEKNFATPNDYSYILTALKGFISATNDSKAKDIMEKITHVSKQNNTNIILDFSVLREGEQTSLHLLQTAIAKRNMVEFEYTNNNKETRIHQVEPIAIVYRWYAWYLLAYSKRKQDYRTYKLIRMCNLKITQVPFIKNHDDADTILKQADQTDSRQYIDIYVKCKKRVQPRVLEYLNGSVIQNLPEGDALMKLTVVKNEQLWFGTLLSFGDDVKVIFPNEIRTQLVAAASKIISLYK